MEKIFDKAGKFIIKYKFFILAVFAVILGLSVVMQGSVSINEDMTKYMPADSDTAIAININEAEFGSNETFSVMISDVAPEDEETYRNTILNVKNGTLVESVSKTADDGNGNILFSVTLKESLTWPEAKKAVDDIRSALSDKKIALEGHAVTENYVDSISGGTAALLIGILIPVMLLILLLTSKSFIDPVICLIVIMASILIGQGTNIIFWAISSITNSMFAVLMIAISMDYSVFMLHTFKEEKDRGADTKQAVLNAIKKSFTTITSASMTTIAGFIAMVFMRFALGADIGWVFAKGIIISLLTAIVLMPCLLLLFNKLIAKTSHRDLLPSFKKTGKAITKIRWGIIPLVLILIGVGVYGSFSNNFVYGNSMVTETPGTPLYEDSQAIINTFGRKNNLVVLCPTEDKTLSDELTLSQGLSDIENVLADDTLSLSVILDRTARGMENSGAPSSLVAMIDGLMDKSFSEVYEFLDGDFRQMGIMSGEEIDGILSFCGKSLNYTRIVLNLSVPEESEATFKTVEDIKLLIPDGAYLLGGSSVALDMKNIVNSDYLLVTLLTVAAIAIIIGIAFKSITLPLILLLCVQGGVFINMAIPALMAQAIPYVAYLLISTIELGATIDYAILMTSKYMANRKIMGKRAAAVNSISQASGSILTSGLILTGAGFAMNLAVADKVVAQMGMLLGRGALISMALVFVFLPSMLMVLDKLIQKTTYKAGFVNADVEGPVEEKPAKIKKQSLRKASETKARINK